MTTTHVCGFVTSKVIDSRAVKELRWRRRRECLLCGFRWTTYELACDPSIQQVVVLPLCHAVPSRRKTGVHGLGTSANVV